MPSEPSRFLGWEHSGRRTAGFYLPLESEGKFNAHQGKAGRDRAKFGRTPRELRPCGGLGLPRCATRPFWSQFRGTRSCPNLADHIQTQGLRPWPPCLV